MKTRIINILKRVARAMSIQEVRVLPGHLAYFFFVSLIPMISIIGIFGSMLNIDITMIIEGFAESVPKDIADILIPYFTSSSWSWGATLSTAMALFLASNATHALIITSNTLFKIDQTSEINTRVKSFFMTFLIIFLMFFIIIILGFGDMIIKFIFSLKIFGDISSAYYVVIAILKWPIAYLFIFYIIKLIFTIAPDASIPSKYMNKGALFSSVLWMVVTAVYSFYVNNIADYSVFYGGLASIVITLMWIYFLSYILVIGIAINMGYYFEKKDNNK